MDLKINDDDISKDTIICRYFSFEAFVSLVESKKLTFAKVTSWEDPWENVLADYELEIDGKSSKSQYCADKYFFGQCWTLKPESDAMWRIYSPNKSGVKLKTVVSKFENIQGINRVNISKVKYFSGVDNLMEMVENDNSHGYTARYKRIDFSHEEEIRVLVHPQDIVRTDEHEASHISLSIDVADFIENIEIDPRAPIWVIDMITSYCNRLLANIPVSQSKLYKKSIQGKLVRRYTFVDK